MGYFGIYDEKLQEIIDEADDLNEARFLLKQYQDAEKLGHTYRIIKTSKPEVYLQGLIAMIGGGPVDLGAMTSDAVLENAIESDGKTILLPDIPEGVVEHLKVIPEEVKLDIPKVYKKI